MLHLYWIKSSHIRAASQRSLRPGLNLFSQNISQELLLKNDSDQFPNRVVARSTSCCFKLVKKLNQASQKSLQNGATFVKPVPPRVPAVWSWPGSARAAPRSSAPRESDDRSVCSSTHTPLSRSLNSAVLQKVESSRGRQNAQTVVQKSPSANPLPRGLLHWDGRLCGVVT